MTRPARRHLYDASMDDPIPPEALLDDVPPAMASIAEDLRRLVCDTFPHAAERVNARWRIIAYHLPVGGRRTAYFAWVMPQIEHVHLGFPKGVLLADPGRLLDGRGITKAARWLTFVRPPDLADERVVALLHEAAAVARMDKEERALLVLDREHDGGRR